MLRIFIGSFVFNIFFWVWSALCVLLSPLILLFPRFLCAWLCFFWAKLILVAAKAFLRLDYEVQGHHLLPQTGCIVASKHQSAWETIAFFVLLQDPVIVLKHSLFRLPFAGWIMKKLHFIPISRKKNPPIFLLKKFFSLSQKTLNQGRPLLIFPEGTRVSPFSPSPGYFSGVFKLYTRSKKPVVPVSLNSGLFWGRRKFLKKPGKITVVFHPPAPQGLSQQAFMAYLKNTLETPPHPSSPPKPSLPLP